MTGTGRGGKRAATGRVKAGTAKASAEQRKAIFVEAYLSNGMNATEAALTAGYSKGGAAKQGYRMSKDPVILSMIGQRREAVLNKYELGTDDVYRSLAQELHFNPKNLYNADGTLKSILELDDDTAMALSGVEFEQLGSQDAPVHVRKIKWAQKAAAREQLIKIRGMYASPLTDPSGAWVTVLKDIAEKLPV